MSFRNLIFGISTVDCDVIGQLVVKSLSVKQTNSCCIPKAMVGWKRRMWNALTEREVLSALEHLWLKFKSTATHDEV